MSENEMERRLDYRGLPWRIDQINPVPGEEEQLREERSACAMVKNWRFCSEAIEQLSDGNGILRL